VAAEVEGCLGDGDDMDRREPGGDIREERGIEIDKFLVLSAGILAEEPLGSAADEELLLPEG